MSSLKVTLCAGVAAVAAVLIPTAYAMGEGDDGGGSVTLTPTAPVAGAEVALRVTGCAGRSALAVSEAFVADARLVGTGGTLVGETQVRSSVEAGTYDVKITCVDFEVKGRIKVVAAALPYDPPRPVDPALPYEPTSPDIPVAPVRAGGGGAAPLAVAADEAPAAHGPGTAQAVTGLALAAVAAAVVTFRSVRRGRRAG
ncbi:hypothetical protein JCM4814A_69650 [Streptomyces phaeofaciens JCM 4814]|uniref:Lipoprotein n=1 Tax=Streptomyces phaeofaciens TaxID=68254 RepID=A0A918H6A8_9ACTN|nr:hypothetical protein [Streptomyces phaeofaciens]GGT42041.1 hypothetical protein GCM10010226_18300 [Streptomyces phaeofaciens]